MRTRRKEQTTQEYVIRYGNGFATLYAPDGSQHSVGGPDAVARLKSEHAAPGRTFLALPFVTERDDSCPRANW